jgi:hypothetical protein
MRQIQKNCNTWSKDGIKKEKKLNLWRKKLIVWREL